MNEIMTIVNMVIGLVTAHPYESMIAVFVVFGIGALRMALNVASYEG